MRKLRKIENWGILSSGTRQIYIYIFRWFDSGPERYSFVVHFHRPNPFLILTEFDYRACHMRAYSLTSCSTRTTWDMHSGDMDDCPPPPPPHSTSNGVAFRRPRRTWSNRRHIRTIHPTRDMPVGSNINLLYLINKNLFWQFISFLLVTRNRFDLFATRFLLN